MSFREIVRDDFEEFIRLDPSVPLALRDSLRLRERVPTLIDNLAGALDEVERRGRIKLDRLKIKQIVFDFTAQFVHNLKTKADEMVMSESAKTLRREELEGDSVAKKFDDQGNADLTEEFGIIIKDREEPKGH